MYLSVQAAARRLGVSPHTVRRWTASGFLPCVRTPGGHRRIKQEDADELAHLIGGRNHLAARLARERELAVLGDTAIAVSSRRNVAELMREIAKQLTTLLDAHSCTLAGVDADGELAVLATYERAARRPGAARTVTRSPSRRRALEEHETVVVNIGDPHVDASELALMRRDGHKCLLVLPLLYQGEAVGLVEVRDRSRERRFSRHELRLAQALAAHAAAAARNAVVMAGLRDGGEEVAALREAVARIAAGSDRLLAAASRTEVLQLAASLAAAALGGLSCVAGFGEEIAGASGLATVTSSPPAARTGAGHVIVSSAACGEGKLTLTLTRTAPAGEGMPELLGLLASVAAGALGRLEAE